MDMKVDEVLQSCQTGGSCAKGRDGLGLDKLHNSFGEILSEQECLVWSSSSLGALGNRLGEKIKS